MGIDEAERLQQEIDEVLAGTDDLRIVLDNGSDCLDLESNVDVRVFVPDSEGYRLFMIATAQWLHYLLVEREKDEWMDWPADERGLFCTGGPLVITREITADVIVNAVRRYLYKESGSGGCG